MRHQIGLFSDCFYRQNPPINQLYSISGKKLSFFAAVQSHGMALCAIDKPFIQA